PPEGAESPDDAAAAPESAATERDEVAHDSTPEGGRDPNEVGAADDSAMSPEQAPVPEASASPQGAGAADVETSGATPDEPGSTTAEIETYFIFTRSHRPRSRGAQRAPRRDERAEAKPGGGRPKAKSG